MHEKKDGNSVHHREDRLPLIFRLLKLTRKLTLKKFTSQTC